MVPILRAGTGLLDGFLSVVPGARVGHVGLYRDPKSLVAVEYYFKMPGGMTERDAIVLDPMLATGNSAVAAVERLKEARPRTIRFVHAKGIRVAMRVSMRKAIWCWLWMTTVIPRKQIASAASFRSLNNNPN